MSNSPKDILIKALEILKADAEMALNNEWDKNDDGFKEQIILIDQALADVNE